MAEETNKMSKGLTVFLVVGVSIAAVGGAILTVGAVRAAMAARAAKKGA